MPGAPLETGRAPEVAVGEVPPAPVQAQAYPPREPYFFPPTGAYSPPDLLVAGQFPAPPPPCPPGDKDCVPPEEPPPEVPEPGTIFILLIGAAAIWFGLRRRKVRS